MNNQRRVRTLASYHAKAFFATVLGMAGFAIAAVPEAAAEPGPEGALDGGRIRTLQFGERVLIRATLRTEAFHKDTHVVVDYAAPAALQVHSNVINSIAYGEGEQTLRISAEGFEVAVPKDAVTAEQGPVLTEITARYANELGNVDAAAILGWPVLRRFSFGLNLHDAELTLAPARGDQPDAAQQSVAERSLGPGGAVVTGVRIVGDTVRVPVARGAARAWMTFGTAGYHTYLNEALAEGAEQDIRFADTALPISGMVALFPQPFEQPAAEADEAADAAEAPEAEAPEEGLLLRSGLGLWSAYALEINPSRGYLALTPVVDSNYSAADAAFYRAAAAADAEGLRAYARKWPADRNMEEAAARLFDIGARQGFPVREQLDAVRLGLAITPERRRMEYVAGFVLPLFAGEDKDRHTDLIIALAEEALRHVGRAERPRLRQNLQLMLGDRYLAQGDAHTAWKTFLAAGFNGDPRLEDVVRHELGRAYEALGRHRRAYSNYQRALTGQAGLPEQMRTSAEAGLARLRPRLAPDDALLAANADG